MAVDNYSKFRYGKDVVVGDGVRIRPSSFVKVGNNVSFGSNCKINTSASGESPIIFGNDIMLAQDVKVIGGDHNYSRIDIPVIKQGEGKQGAIVIEDDVWLAANVIVLSGVTIGKGSIIGAGAVVTKSIPPYSIAVGNPAKVIRSRK